MDEQDGQDEFQISNFRDQISELRVKSEELRVRSSESDFWDGENLGRRQVFVYGRF